MGEKLEVVVGTVVEMLLRGNEKARGCSSSKARKTVVKAPRSGVSAP